jgi:hypothetical protein
MVVYVLMMEPQQLVKILQPVKMLYHHKIKMIVMINQNNQIVFW